MKFDKVIPTDRLKPYIKHFVVSENTLESTYKIFPSTSLVIGFQYKGQLFSIESETETNLNPSGITGLMNSFKLFRNTSDIGTILVYFTELGLNAFTHCPAHELFQQSVSLDVIFNRYAITETEEKLALAHTDTQRIEIVEQFLLSQLKDIQPDRLVLEAVKLIYQSQGAIKISDLNTQLCISQSPFEKRFRKEVGTTPKKFASIVRFNAVIESLNNAKSLTEIGYFHLFFDQAHFIKDFRQFTGTTPENFRRAL
ncbi:helix-turn-helix domain-containing protein [Cytophagaceae bacterium YF14B1]|uniref:Helix-turn-helix domain-containing protein n=1 Tax=Xanthocytophaga flava TaxID=3048013 RepID=A0AAE3U6E8_9BACT|nr:helix-turn-helix domain-containing protein [Xanthocytophaga flavus]MDJ1481769.1 helix-turn-helix domain-containing protein [Xanthocytophaga flavus]